MPFSGGTYTKWNNGTGGWAGDAAALTGITASRHDSQDDDFATAINQCLTKNGANTPTANLPMGGYKHTNVANATAATEYMAYGQIRNGTPLYMDTANNRLGINTSSPTHSLHVVGNIKTTTGFESDASCTVGDGTTSKSLLVNGANTGTGAGGWVGAQTNGATRVGIGNYSAMLGGAFDNTPTIYFAAAPRVTGLAAGAGTNAMRWDTGTSAWTYDTSSARYKENIVDANYGLAAITAMQPRAFTYKDSGRPDIGFIAEELIEVVPELVHKNADGLPDSVSYDRLTAVLCKAIQELTARVKTLEEKIDATNSEGQ